MHPLERQYIHILQDSLTWPASQSRAGAVHRALMPPRLDWLCAPHDGFPLLTSKRVWWRAVVAEFCWMMQGRTDIAYLKEHGVEGIWQPWALEDGTIGRAYGYQIDREGRHLVSSALTELEQDPDSRRACWTLWVDRDLPHMALPPCHGAFCQLRQIGDQLHLHMHQRSADWAVGVPFNIAFYALLLRVCAAWLGVREGGLHLTYGDAHLYGNHREGVKQQIWQWSQSVARGINAPEVRLRKDKMGHCGAWLRSLEPADFELLGYAPMAQVKYEVAV